MAKLISFIAWTVVITLGVVGVVIALIIVFFLLATFPILWLPLIICGMWLGFCFLSTVLGASCGD